RHWTYAAIPDSVIPCGDSGCRGGGGGGAGRDRLGTASLYGIAMGFRDAAGRPGRCYGVCRGSAHRKLLSWGKEREWTRRVLFSCLQLPAILLHFCAQPALQAGAEGGRKIGKLDAVLASLVGPGYATGKLRLFARPRYGEDERQRSARFEDPFSLDTRATGTYVQQGAVKALAGVFHLDGNLDLGAIIALLADAQCAGRVLKFGLAIALELTDQCPAGDAEGLRGPALVAAVFLQG